MRNLYVSLIVCSSLVLLPCCKKHKIKVLSGTYTGIVKLRSVSYGPQGGNTSDTSYEHSIEVSQTGKDSIIIDGVSFLYNNEDKYVTGGYKYQFEAEFKSKRTIWVRKSYSGSSGTAGSGSTYEFEGKKE